MRLNYLFILLILSVTSQTAVSQSKFSFMPGLYYNGSFLNENVSGIGLNMGVEYQQHKEHFFSIELRSKYGFYFFNDGTKWTERNGLPVSPIRDKARLEYRLFSPQVSIVPKFHLHLFEEELSLFLENEFAVGLMAGSFKYNGEPYTKKQFTEPVFSYNISIGAEFRDGKYPVIASIGYSSLNFRNKIEKHQPQNYQGRIPNQDAIIIINLILKVPLGR